MLSELDREQQSAYTLIIEVWDNYQFGFTAGESRNAFKQIRFVVRGRQREDGERERGMEGSEIERRERGKERDMVETRKGREHYSVVRRRAK